MNWAHYAIEKLQAGEQVTIKPRGNSMSGKIESGQPCVITPTSNIAVGDIVLCKVKGNVYLHLVKAVKDDMFLIGNNHGKINGWTHKRNIYGVCVAIEHKAIHERE